MSDKVPSPRCDLCGRFYKRTDPFCWDCEHRLNQEVWKRKGVQHLPEQDLDLSRSSSRVE